MCIQREKGFSLVEVLVVIALIGIMLGIGGPAVISQMSHIKFTRAVRDVATELNAARLKAIAESKPMQVAFSGATYRLKECNSPPCADDEWTDYPTRGARELGTGATITAPGSTFTVAFFANGTATATLICMRNASDAGDQMGISITGTTGLIKVTTGCTT
ncbi:MAG: prepilin-type N-terminal cleavage/methylation domain-containing protein [Thermodesulfobacteriota bacterium]|nr:MAG: prepilin-type N-terminal cleavage/methylation domain-containing protein [Thermodesulfobacteriota bacterium]